MVDWLGATEVASSAFFVVLAIVLLARYRQASGSVTAANELNHELWKALEDRLKKQDERIVDLVAKVEVLQARMASMAAQTQHLTSQPVTPSQPQVQPQAAPQPAPAPRIPAPILIDLDATEKAALRFLADGPKKTPDIMKGTGRSREHTARLMKSLYDRGLVERDESSKPFVYRLTDAARRYLSAT